MCRSLSFLVVILGLAFAARAEEPATARLPLDQLLSLHKTIDAAKDAKPPRPPVAAILESVDLTATLLDDRAVFTGTIRASILGTGWTELPLLPNGAGTRWDSVSGPSGAYTTIRNGKLTLVTEMPRTLELAVTFTEPATRTGGKRKVVLQASDSVVQRLRVKADGAGFEFLGDGDRDGDLVTISAENGRYSLEWSVPTAAVATQKVIAPDVDPVANAARASLVSTLEGRQILRVRYELQIATTKPFTCTVPPGFTFRRAYLNGVSTEPAIEGDQVTLQAAPVRAGERAATVEIAFDRDDARYALAGTVNVELPRVSWMVHETTLAVHLPAVFNYRWSGGSLSAMDDLPTTTYALQIPTPGTTLAFRQHLVAASAPSLTLRYTVDLASAVHR